MATSGSDFAAVVSLKDGDKEELSYSIHIYHAAKHVQVLLAALHTAVYKQFEIPQYLFRSPYSFTSTVILRELQMISYLPTFQHQ